MWCHCAPLIIRFSSLLFSLSVWEVKFDSSHPNNLFTCSQDGGLWHWDINNAASTTTNQPTHQHTTNQPHLPTAAAGMRNPASFPPPHALDPVEDGPPSASTGSLWLSGAAEQAFIQDYSPGPRGTALPVNSLDIESKHLVCSTDGEALLVVPDLTLR